MANMGFGFIVSLRDRFSQKARTAGAAMGGLERNARGLKKWLGGIGFGKLAGLAGATAGMYGLSRMVTDGTRTYMKFDEAMRKVQTLLIGDLGVTKAREETDRLSETVRQLSLEYGQEVIPMANALWLAISSGVSANKAPAFLEELGRKAVQAGADMSVMTEAISTVLDNYGESAGTFKEISDNMFMTMVKGSLDFSELAGAMSKALPLAAKLGISYEEVMASIAGLTRGTGNASEASTKLEGVFSALLRLPPMLTAELNQMGFDMSRASTKERGLIETLRQLDAHMKKIDYRNVGLQLDSLGLSFKGIHLQGKNAGIAAGIIVKEMGKADWRDTNVALQQMGITIERTKWDAMNDGLKLSTVSSSLKDARFGMARIFRDVSAMAGALGLIGKQGEVATEVMTSFGDAADVNNAALKALEDTPMFKMKKMQAQWDEVKMKLGQQFVPVLLKLGKVMETIKWDPIVDAFGRLFAALPTIIDRLINMGEAAEKAMGWFGDASNALAGVIEAGGASKETSQTAADTTVGVGVAVLFSKLLGMMKGGGGAGGGGFAKMLPWLLTKVTSVAVGAAAGYAAKATHQTVTGGMDTAPGRALLSIVRPDVVKDYYNLQDTLKQTPGAQISSTFGAAKADDSTRRWVEKMQAEEKAKAELAARGGGSGALGNMLMAGASGGMFATKEDLKGVIASIKAIASRPIDLRLTADVDGLTLFEVIRKIEQREAAR